MGHDKSRFEPQNLLIFNQCTLVKTLHVENKSFQQIGFWQQVIYFNCTGAADSSIIVFALVG